MQYRNTELKMDQIIGYLNQKKINLSPAFQRGHVWKLKDRQSLVRNIVLGRPIPAIFLYKEPAGAIYTYNILDGKQRIESLILFIGAGIEELGIANWADYFYLAEHRKNVSFAVDLPGGKRKFRQLDEFTTRNFREYSIPTVEINLTDDTELDEIIDLFVDINQRGEPVKRFDIVKAMGKENKLLESVFDLVATEQEKKQDVVYKPRAGNFNMVLGNLSVIANITNPNAAVDRTWERLLEIALFVRTGKHRKPVEVLKRFINARASEAALTAQEKTRLKRVFKFLRKAYTTHTRMKKMRIATDQTHFYTMATALIDSSLTEDYGDSALVKKLFAFANLIEEGARAAKDKRLALLVKEYLEISSKQTTDVSRRDERQRLFIEAIEAI